MKKVWLVTGASKGLGLKLVEKLLASGYRVAATSRKRDDLQKAVGEKSENFIPLETDVTDEASVEKAVTAAIAHFGHIDVVVNNAGYGLAGALEELTDAESRENFDVNVFGALNVIRKVLPHMREQGSGRIFNVASIAGFIGSFPGFGIYCATKFAMHGFSESLAAEVEPFGIKVTIVSPGYFRTGFLSSASLKVPKHEIGAYENVRQVQKVHENEYNGNQPGDPEKAATAFIKIAEQQNPPLHLFLGQDAYDLAESKIKAVQKDLDTEKELATATAFVTA